MKKLIFIISVLIIAACGNDTSVPKEIIPIDKMTSILMDYHVAEQEVGKTILSYDSAKYLFHSIYYPEVLTKHEVSKEKFEKSFQYYTEHINQFEMVYKAVEDSLKIKQEALEKDQKEE